MFYVLLHLIHTAYVAPQFLQQFYTFDESGVVNGAPAVPMVCLRGGQYHERREFALLVASGPEENCFGQPCPPATGNYCHMHLIR